MTITSVQATDPVAAAASLSTFLAERADQTERDRRVSDEAIDALYDAGLYNYVVPKRWGGQDGSLITQIEVAAELAKSCSATAWVYMITANLGAFAAAYLSEEGARAIHGGKDRPVVCGVNGFTGSARAAGEHEYVVSGTWGFASGCLNANWFMGGVLVLDENGDMVNQGWAFIPMSELKIKDTWHVAGMKGTGSNTVIATDVVVPEHLIMFMTDRLGHESEFHPGDETIDRMPFAALFSTALMGPSLGMAQALLEKVAAGAPDRGISYFDFNRQTDSGALLERLGKAALDIDTAWLHIRRSAHALEETTRTQTLDYVTRARCRADAAQAAEHVRAAVDSLLSIAGASSFAETNPIQRLWRDINMATRHAFLNSGPIFEAYARAYVGVTPNITLYI